MDWALWGILCVFSAILYRLGGWEHGNTKYRDIGVPLCVSAIVAILGQWHWSGYISEVLMFGAMCTYWKSGTDCRWYNWFITGLMYAVAWLPYCNMTNNQLGFALYAIIVSISTCVWSELIDNDIAEEMGRGFIVAFFAPLLCSDIVKLLTKGLGIQ